MTKQIYKGVIFIKECNSLNHVAVATCSQYLRDLIMERLEKNIRKELNRLKNESEIFSIENYVDTYDMFKSGQLKLNMDRKFFNYYTIVNYTNALMSHRWICVYLEKKRIHLNLRQNG